MLLFLYLRAISLDGDKVAERTAVATLAAIKAEDDLINQEESYYMHDNSSLNNYSIKFVRNFCLYCIFKLIKLCMTA